MHLYSHKNCALCREVKQRRTYSKPVPIEKQNRVTKAFHKTDIDHIIMGNHTPGILGETVGLVARDEHLGWVSFSGDKNRDAPAVADGLRHHFGKELNKAQSRGFTIYSDSAGEFSKVCKKLKLLHRPATPNSEEANARHERFMGVFGDLIRTVLFQSGLPLMFWTYAAAFVADVYNMTVIPYKKSKTPYELRYPSRSLPKIPRFGSLVTYVPKKIEKHSARSRRGIVLGYAQMPGGYVTDEFIVVPLECFTKGLKTVNLVVSRDVRIPTTPTFQIKEWNSLAETRSYIEKFKPLCGESYYENIWAKAIDIKIKNGIPQHREIIVLRDGNPRSGRT